MGCQLTSPIKHCLFLAALSLSIPFNVALADNDLNSGQLKDEMKVLEHQVYALNKRVNSINQTKNRSVRYWGNNQHPTQRNSNPAPINNYDDYDAASPQWYQNASNFHLTGYADAGYVNQQGENGRLVIGQFNPILLYTYKDLILAEGELEITVDSEGETGVELEFGNLTLLLHNNLMFLIGRMLSPVGYFQQNLHPTWINKLPSKPAGFGEDEAAPATEVGAQLRGSFIVCYPAKVTYSLYVGNGPKANVEDNVIEEIIPEGFNADIDGSKVYGGRIGFQPLGNLEFGVSAAIGKIGLFTDQMIDLRRYTVLGADASFAYKNLELRGEIIQQKINEKAGSMIAGGKWLGWYGQAAYRFKPTKFEAIARYSRYDAPDPAKSYDQWSLGLDYWFEPNVVAKISYDINTADEIPEGEANSPIGNAFYLQLAYGF